MRQLIIKIPKKNRDAVSNTIEDYKGKNTFHFTSDKKEVFFTHLPNNKVNNFLESIDKFGEPEIAIIPRGIITLYPPAMEAPEQVADVQQKSSLEIYQQTGISGINDKKKRVAGTVFGLLTRIRRTTLLRLIRWSQMGLL